MTMPRPKATGEPTCEHCGRTFTTASAKSRHRRACDGVPDPMALLKAELARLTEENRMLKEANAHLSSSSHALPCTINNTTTNNTNNTTTHNNNVNVTYNINLFRREDTSYITDELLKRFNTSDDLTSKLLELVVMTHFNRDHPENMNAFVPNGAEDGKVFGKKGWQTMPLHDMAEMITYDMGQLMWGHVEDNEGLYRKRQADRVEAMYDMLKLPLTRAPIVEGTKATILENSHVVVNALESRPRAD